MVHYYTITLTATLHFTTYLVLDWNKFLLCQFICCFFTCKNKILTFYYWQRECTSRMEEEKKGKIRRLRKASKLSIYGSVCLSAGGARSGRERWIECVLKPNSWTYNLLRFLNTVLRVQTWFVHIQCLHFKPVSNHLCWGGGEEGGGWWVKTVSRVTLNGKEENYRYFCPNYVQEIGLCRVTVYANAEPYISMCTRAPEFKSLRLATTFKKFKDNASWPRNH